MTKLPEFVYLIETTAEWSVDAVAGDHPSAPEWIAERVAKRRKSGNVGADGEVRVWRARLADVVEMEITPALVTPATLSPKEQR